MTTHELVLDFNNIICADPAVRANFHNKLSYWWASILWARFAKSESDKDVSIIYNEKLPRFGVIIAGRAYDALGEIPYNDLDDYVSWDYYGHSNTNEADEVLRTQIYYLSPEEWKIQIEKSLAAQNDKV